MCSSIYRRSCISLPGKAGFIALVVLLSAACQDSSLSSTPPPANLPPSTTAPPYADTEWPSVHAGPRNDDYVALQIAGRYQHKWSALKGAAVLAAPTIGPEGNIYLTTGQGPGNSTLHAFRQDGTTLWETAPWATTADFDSCAVLQSAIVDEAGDLYISDCNQFWAFHSDGTIKWVVDLPIPPAGTPFQDGAVTAPVNPFVTPFFTRDGAVGGVTVFGDVVIVNRADGTSAAPVINLPGELAPPPDRVLPSTLWAGGFMDPEIIELSFNVLLAGVVESANTPAVAPESGRIFVTGTDITMGLGALYGIDFTPGNPGLIDIATSSVIGPGSGSSPAISPDDSAVYVSDDDGKIYSFDVGTGERNWELDIGAAAGSASVGPDGTLYVPAGNLTAVTPDGVLKWTADLSAVAEARLPADPDFTRRYAFPNGIATVTDNALLVPHFVGYAYNLGGIDRPIIIEQLYLALDPATGQLLDGSQPYSGANGSNEGFAVPLQDGTVLVNSAEFFTTGLEIIAPLVNPLLPQGYRILEAVGGLEALAPAP